MTIYHERLWPAPWVFISTALVIPASLLVFLPISPTVGILVAVLLYVGIAALLVVSTPIVEVTDTEFVAGKARLPLAVIGEVTPWLGEDARLQRGQLLDARAYLVIRGWIDPVVRVELLDAQDPTPYWLVSSRRPAQIQAAIATARGAGRDAS